MKITGKQKQELFIAWCFTIPALIALVEINTKFVALGMSSGGGEQNAALFPRLLSYALLFLVLVKTTEILIRPKFEPSPEEKTITFFEHRGRKKMAAMLVVLIAYFLGLTYLGYYVSTPLALIAFFMILEIRHSLVLILLSVGTTLFIWYTFSILLHVILPVGKFGLYF